VTQFPGKWKGLCIVDHLCSPAYILPNADLSHDNLKRNGMNVFILNTGRCGSLTFSRACRHITRPERLNYPDNHIEADNRLSWFLGGVDSKYGDSAVYVHLMRNRTDTAKSFMRRYPHSIIKAYRQAILKGSSDNPMAICLDYCETVDSNIESFLEDKTRKMDFRIESAKEDFVRFWEMIGAEGDMEAALAEFDIRYNASGKPEPGRNRKNGLPSRLAAKLRRIIVNLPNYIRHG
jgi:hypothetical protein